MAIEDETPLPERELLDYAARMAHGRRDERVAVHLHFSGLHAGYRNPDYIRIATGIFINQISTYGGRYFQLGNNDVVYIARDATKTTLEAAVNRVRMLFSEDSLTRPVSGESPAFCTYYFLDQDYNRFMESCRTLLEDAEALLRHNDFVAQIVMRPNEKPFSASDSVELESKLENADLAPVIRKQPVVTIQPGKQPEIIFDEIYVSISDLRMTLAPHLNPAGDTWLFQRLTQNLDKRMLAHLVREGLRHERPFSINLNVATALSAEFRHFNEHIASNLRKTLVVEFNKIDVFADMGAFIFVRDYLHEYGYRLCLDGLNHLTLPYFDRERLGFDLIKMRWATGGIADMQPEKIPEIRTRILGYGQARVILCRCESRQALQIGQELGIVMFQGREIDRVLAAETAKAPR